MQICPDTPDMIGGAIAPADESRILFDLAERTGTTRPILNTEREAGKRRTPEQIQADLETKYKSDLDRLNARFASKIADATARVKPVGERRKEALVKLDELRAIVRRTSPAMDESGIDALILNAVKKEHGDLADGATTLDD